MQSRSHDSGLARGPAFFLTVLAVLLVNDAHSRVSTHIPAPKLDAKSYLLLDHRTSKVLAEQDADHRADPASLTKIMTIYVAGHALQSGLIALDDKVKVSEKAWKMEGSRMFIEAGKYVSVDDLLQGVIVQSGNDASVALAEHISGTEDLFATIMNEHARQLGMSNSSFSNSTGLPDAETFTTARDMALLSSALISEFPTLYARFAIQEFTFNNIRQPNRNRLLVRDDSFDGIKTGHTEAAGFCLVSSADRNGTRLIAAVMGTRSDTARTEASLTLVNYGFRLFETRKLYERTDVIASSKVWKGVVGQLNLGASHVVYITIPRGRYDELEAVAQLNEPVVAPINVGQVLGQIRISLDGEQIKAVPLIALDDIEAGSFFSRLYDGVMLLIE